MADKSAYIPVDVVGSGHKMTDLDVDMDAELFGSGVKKEPTPVAPVPPVTPVTPPPPAPAPVTAPAPKFQYKKAATFTKTYASKKK